MKQLVLCYHARVSPPPKGKIMIKTETDKLFRLLKELYPNTGRFSDESAKLAWQLVLEPFEYDAIKAAAVAFARHHKYPPDPRDLCAGMVPDASKEPAREDAGSAWERWIAEGKARDAADELGSVSRYARENGLTWEEAKERLKFLEESHDE